MDLSDLGLMALYSEVHPTVTYIVHYGINLLAPVYKLQVGAVGGGEGEREREGEERERESGMEERVGEREGKERAEERGEERREKR